MKVLGIGNAIVDVICKVEESFLSENNLTKSTMKLVDEVEFKKLLSNLKIEQTIAGGSVANSIVGLSQLGNPVSSGIYFYELRSPSFTSRKKMLLIR